jgi:hypothetical protein
LDLDPISFLALEFVDPYRRVGAAGAGLLFKEEIADE